MVSCAPLFPALAHSKANGQEFKGLPFLQMVTLVFTCYMSSLTPVIMKKYKYIFHTYAERYMELPENTCNKLKVYAPYLYE